MEYGSEWAYNNIDAWAFRKHAFQAQHQYHYSLSEKFIHTLENKVLMHQCTIVQMISTKQLWTLNFEYWIFAERNSSSLTSFPTGEDGRGFFKASFHRLHHLLSALSQAIPPCFERKTEPLPTPPSFCRRTKCRGENNLLEIPCCPVSWLALCFPSAIAEQRPLVPTGEGWDRLPFYSEMKTKANFHLHFSRFSISL